MRRTPHAWSRLSRKSLTVSVMRAGRSVWCRGLLDAAPVHVEPDLAGGPVDTGHRVGRHGHLAAREPSARIDDDLLHRPVDVVDHEVVDAADRAVACLGLVADQL